MNVETYEVNEIKTDCTDDKTELIALSEKLGLSGQKKLLNGDPTSTFPYRKMTQEEDRVYSVMLTGKCSLNQFEESVIPLRVLQIASHAEQFPETRHMKVWYSPSQPDPILVGMQSEYSGPTFILARWGDVLDSFHIVKQKALAKLIVKAKNEIAEKVQKVKAFESGIEERCAAYLDGSESKYAPDVF